MIALAQQCVKFSDLLTSMMGRELRSRYRGSVLGSLWMILQPLMFLVIYYVVFIEFFQQKADLQNQKSFFALAMFAGLVPWISISETLSRATGTILENGNLIKKFAFPAEILPVYLVGISLINTVVGFAVLALGVFFIEGQLPRMAWLFPLVLVLQGAYTLGLAYFFSALAVFIRDLIPMVPMLMTFWFFMSPIFFFAKLSTISETAALVFRLNPISYIVELYRVIFIYDPEIMKAQYARPDFDRNKVALDSPWGEVPWSHLGILAAVSLVFLVLGYRVFMKLKPRFADEV